MPCGCLGVPANALPVSLSRSCMIYAFPRPAGRSRTKVRKINNANNPPPQIKPKEAELNFAWPAPASGWSCI